MVRATLIGAVVILTRVISLTSIIIIDTFIIPSISQMLTTRVTGMAVTVSMRKRMVVVSMVTAMAMVAMMTGAAPHTQLPQRRS